MVESVAIAHQNAQRPFGSRRGNVDWNVLHHAFAAIWPQHGFDGNVVARSSFGDIGSSTFETGPAAFANHVEIKLHAMNGRHAIGIVKDAAEPVAQGDRS